MASIGSATIDIIADTRGFTRDAAGRLRNAQGQYVREGRLAGQGYAQGATDGASGTVGSLRGLVAGALGFGVGAAVLGTIRSIGTIGVAYQDTLNTFGAVADKAQLAAAGGLEAVSAAAKTLGNDLSLPATSAADAGVAFTELAKAGLSVKEALAAGKGTLELATAGSLDAGEAATIAANALNTFGLAGDQAGRVANVLANAANVSSGEVGDFAGALAQGGLVAKQAGLSIEETAGALALFANKGLKGSDAGTSLKTALLRLQAPTSQVAGELKKLGINVRDSSGNIKPLADISQTLQDRLKGLSSAQRDAALNTIFGSDAIRAGTLLYEAGGKGVDSYTASVGKAGGAAAVAAAKSMGLGGAFRGLGSQLETIKISVFEAVAPSVERATRAVSGAIPAITTGAVALGTAIKTGITTGVGDLSRIVDLGPLRAGLATAATEIASFFTTLTAQPQTTLDAGSIVAVDAAALRGPDGPGAQIATAIKEGIDGGIDGIDPKALGVRLGTLLASAVETLGQSSAALVASFGKFVGDVAPELALAFGKAAPAILLGLATGLVTFDARPIFAFIGDNLFDVILGVITLAFLPSKIIGVFAKVPFIGPLVEGLLTGAKAGSQALVRAGGDLIGGLIRGIESTGPRFLSRIILFAQRGIGEIRVAFRLGLARAQQLLQAFPGQAAGALTQLPGRLGNIAGQAVGLFVRAVTFLPRLALAPFRLLFPGITSTLSSLPGRLAALGGATILGFVQGIRDKAGAVISAIKNAITDRLPGFVKKALGINSPSRVFAELGGFVSEGFAEGVASKASLVVKAVQKMADDATQGSAPPTSPPPGSAPG